MSALLAVVDSPDEPVISYAHAEWATGVAYREIESFLSRVRAGDVGGGSDSRVKKIQDVLLKYRLGQIAKNDPKANQLRDYGIISYRVIQMQASSFAPFRNAEGKCDSRLIREAINDLIDRGQLKQLASLDLPKYSIVSGTYYYIVEYN